jgi:nicotinamidase-related amidase
MEANSARRPALLVVDMQQGLFNGPDQPYEAQRILDNINALIRQAREVGAPVLAARHTGPAGSPLEPGSLSTRLIDALLVDSRSDLVFDKTRPSCFLGTELDAELKRIGANELVVVGMKTQYCIDTTCRAASERGFRTVLIEDAHTCMDTPVLSARHIIDHHNATLRNAFARVVATADFRF